MNLNGSKNLGSDQSLFKSLYKNVNKFLLEINPFLKMYMISSCYEKDESGTVAAMMTLQGTTTFDRACVTDELKPEEVRAKKVH